MGSRLSKNSLRKKQIEKSSDITVLSDIVKLSTLSIESADKKLKEISDLCKGKDGK